MLTNIGLFANAGLRENCHRQIKTYGDSFSIHLAWLLKH